LTPPPPKLKYMSSRSILDPKLNAIANPDEKSFDLITRPLGIFKNMSHVADPNVTISDILFS
jgi:hypothetical protein